MGDKSPKAVNKQATQKQQAKNDAAKRKSGNGAESDMARQTPKK